MSKVHFFHRRLNVAYRKNPKTTLTEEQAAVTFAFKTELEEAPGRYKVYVAAAFTSPGDQFCRKTGRLKAEHRLDSPKQSFSFSVYRKENWPASSVDFRGIEKSILDKMTPERWPCRWVAVAEQEPPLVELPEGLR